MCLEGLTSEDGVSPALWAAGAPVQWQGAGLRVLMYSHDTFGLGHLRRSQAIAEALTGANPSATVKILTGAPSAAAFPASGRIHLVRLPPVRKRLDGSYVSGDERRSLAETIRIRQAIIFTEALHFAPQLTIVDKEPSGFDGEMLPALKHLRNSGSKIVLGLRDVLDAPEPLREEWARKQALRWIERYYDELWIYGPSTFHDPLTGVDVPSHLSARTHYTGFIGRCLTGNSSPCGTRDGHLLVTAGGGADGYPLLVRSISALADLRIENVVIVAGPYMAPGALSDLKRRAEKVQGLTVIAFDPKMQDLVASSRALIAMCGYNTFCEALSFDKPTLYVPRISPRREQSIRAHRAQTLGWSSMITLGEAADCRRFAAAIEHLLHQAPPSGSQTRPDMSGLATIGSLLAPLLSQAQTMPRQPACPQL